MRYIAYCLLFTVLSCSTVQAPEKPPVVVTPVVVKSSFPNQEWTDIAYKAIASSKLASATPRDLKDFCPGKDSATSFTVLMAAMAKYESNYNPNTEYRENFKDVKGNYIISTGLMQISAESSKAYGCPVTGQAWLKDPKNNLECSVKILEKWIVNDGVITGKSGSKWLGVARYFSVLRYKVNEIKAVMKPYCR